MPVEKWDEEKITKLLGKQSRLTLQISRVLGDIEPPFTMQVLIDPKEYSGIRNGVVEKYSKERPVIFITLNVEFAKIVKDLEKAGVGTENVFFIDLVSVERTLETKEAGKVVYLDSPTELTECMLQVEKNLVAKGKPPVVILDSVSTMLVYNDHSSVEKFVHTLIGKVNSKKASAIILSSDSKQAEPTTKTISQFVDRTITV